MNKYIIYLAAGNSRRFGTNKLLFEYHGKPLYRYGLETVTEFCRNREDCSPLVVSQYPEILHEAEAKGIETVYSPDSYKGMSFTIKAALGALEDIEEEDFLMFVVADQPFLTVGLLEKMIEKITEDVDTVSAAYGGSPGNPTVFSARLIPELLALKEDEGGRKVIRKHSCIYVEARDEKELWDIDTKKDLKLSERTWV